MCSIPVYSSESAASSRPETKTSRQPGEWPSSVPRYAIREDVLRVIRAGDPIPAGKQGILTEAWYQDATKNGIL